MIRLLIVDDSALMRNLLAQVFYDEGGFEVRLAKDGMEALEENRSFRPDVVTLDINMPGLDGIAALSRIMAERPVPVVMVSSMTEKGALATLEALNLGAVDFVTKPGGTHSKGIGEISAELVSKVRSALGAKPKGPSPGPAEPVQADHPALREPVAARGGPPRDGVVLMGASIGGPRTLEEILQRLPADLAWPIVVVQHMPSTISKSFAERLNRHCALEVVEAAIPMVLKPGTAYLAQGGGDLVFTRHGGRLAVLPWPESPNHPWHPSVELLGRSVLEHCEPRRVIGVMLTGMGFDGADSFTEIKKGGGRTIAESESSAVVFGMPAELIQRGGATVVLPMEEIAEQIVEWVDRSTDGTDGGTAPI
jgi:two-component system, chemotaxis family, protein-glutamate methylesterase/glutaminase